jgi:hypothetical protein
MADDKTKQGRQDDSRVDINDINEVEYIHRQFPNKQHDEIVRAIQEAGPMREKIMERLRGGR